MHAAGEEASTWNSHSYGETEWIDIENPSQKDTDSLAGRYTFHPLNLEDCISKRQLTKVENHESYLFILLHFPSLGQERIVVRNQLSIFLGKQYIVSLHRSELALVTEMAKALELDEVLRSNLMKSPAYLTYAIIDKLVDGIFPILDKITNDLDAIEDEVFDERVSSARSISRLRREIADLRRIISPLRRSIVDISALAQKYASENLTLYFADVRDHVEKAWEILEATKEVVEIYKDSDFILSSEKTNKVLSILTIIFTLSIPATVIASIYGMNVPLPGGIGDNPAAMFGTYTSFLFLLLGMSVPALLMAWYFRRLGWL